MSQDRTPPQTGGCPFVEANQTTYTAQNKSPVGGLWPWKPEGRTSGTVCQLVHCTGLLLRVPLFGCFKIKEQPLGTPSFEVSPYIYKKSSRRYPPGSLHKENGPSQDPSPVGKGVRRSNRRSFGLADGTAPPRDKLWPCFAGENRRGVSLLDVRVFADTSPGKTEICPVVIGSL